MAKLVEDNLIQINDFKNERGYWGKGLKLAAVRLLRFCYHIFLKNVLIFFDRGAFILVLPII